MRTVVSERSGGRAMKVYVISMTSSVERRKFQIKQLSQLSLEFEIYDAVTVRSLSSDRIATLRGDWERPLSDVEVACYESHYQLWKRVAEEGEPRLILEDDVILSDAVVPFLSEIANHPYYHVSLETRKRKKLLANQSSFEFFTTELYRMYQDRTGAAAYLLSPKGARLLLARHAKFGAALADAQICRAYELDSYQTVPALAVQADCAADYGVALDLATTSSILNSRHKVDYVEGQAWRYKLRRLVAQLRMTCRRLSVLGRAHRRHVSFKR